MRVITFRNVAIQFDANQITHGTPLEQVNQAIALINGVLQREPYGFGAQVVRGDLRGGEADGGSIKVEEVAEELT
ncbi:MAG: hypothetical protein A2X93_07450 [Deltaproteobacteria bacterium GWC2_56_8]|nr:MAG: hypothetical protein A2X99_02265 [Deltaproteobacteria bacterium GWB2_55_19]OGP35248.1 MAG: hypothetical protein A2X93_07450 [Deltaproteobacteria bacterium GWC2_56_8]